MSFQKGDIVQVCYSSPRMIEEWMAGLRPVGQGDVGVVKYDMPALAELQRDYANWTGATVTVTFPMIGTYGIHARDLKLLQRAEAEPCPNGSNAGT